MRAAQHEAVTALRAATATGPPEQLPPSGVDDWMRLGLLDTLLAWFAGTGNTCLHMPDPRRPEPVWSCAWKPRLVVCNHCLHLLKTAGDADRTCDCCGHLCAGTDTDDPIYICTVLLSALTYQAGTCRDCLPTTTARQGETS